MGPEYTGDMTLTFLGHVTSSVTWPFEFQYAISYWWSIWIKSVSPAVFEIQGHKHIGVTASTFQGHVTSSVTWPFDSQVAVSYRCFTGSKSVSTAVVEIMGPKYIGIGDEGPGRRSWWLAGPTRVTRTSGGCRQSEADEWDDVVDGSSLLVPRCQFTNVNEKLFINASHTHYSQLADRWRRSRYRTCTCTEQLHGQRI